MTTAFWLFSSLTVTFLAAVAWAFWATIRIADLIEAAMSTRQHSEAGAQYANRAALDARAMLDVLTEHWQAMRETQPETQPMERVGTDTVESARVIDDGMDEFLNAARARWAQIAAAPAEKLTAEKPTAKARRSQV